MEHESPIRMEKEAIKIAGDRNLYRYTFVVGDDADRKPDNEPSEAEKSDG